MYKYIKASDLKEVLNQLPDNAIIRVIHIDDPESYKVHDAIEVHANHQDNIVEIFF